VARVFGPVPPFRTYRLPNGERLVEEALPSAEAFRLDPDGSLTITSDRFGHPRPTPLVVEPRIYAHVGADGARIRTHGGRTTSYSVDDYLYVWPLFFVRGDTLVRAMLEEGGMGALRTFLQQEEVLLRGLVLVE
jgi:hypothetical protein